VTVVPFHRVDGPDDAPVLVLGPSLGTTLDSWDPLLPVLTPHWRVVRYDLPGHGGSRAIAGPVTVDDLADDVLALLGKLGVGRFAYAGVSLGGSIGTAIASCPAERDRLASLTLICTSARFGEPDPWLARAALARAEGLAPIAAGQAARWFTAGFAATEPERVERALVTLRGVDPESYAACVAAVGGIDLRDRLEAIAAPTLVIGGVDDPATPPDHARILAGGIPSARLTLLPNASHLVYVERPDAVAGLLAAHLSATWPGRAPATAAERYDAGMAVRRAVLGDAHVDRAAANTDAFNADFQDLITRYA
jgi:3-oxoadipate enol-lactonase / 4-carboxymuconolactone decarboxylase